ncbi:Protein O-mannosyl-transferase tmtc2 [Saguinus oedipus]|uniref:Protein O-mannosyl-transferase tmtc2 n=1 Tax=Saguinus oedipus TaxID=9490 RepID=A0ABQ9UZN7_SAGOE|nr:Protein O-mannosyl-transferase tmtc2 [Saguinus oedipus]
MCIGEDLSSCHSLHQLMSYTWQRATTPYGVVLTKKYPAALMNLGAILHLNGRLQKAEANYLRALQLKPDDVITQSNLRKLWNIMEKQGLKTSKT